MFPAAAIVIRLRLLGQWWGKYLNKRLVLFWLFGDYRLVSGLPFIESLFYPRTSWDYVCVITTVKRTISALLIPARRERASAFSLAMGPRCR